MYHISNFGRFGLRLQVVADIGGYVPELGDNLDDFSYPFDFSDDPDERRDEWHNLVRRAATLTGSP